MEGSEVESSRVLSYILMVLLLMVAAGMWYVYHRVKNRRFYELADKLPGPKAFPIIGNAHLVWGMEVTDLFNFMYGMSHDYSCLGRIWFGPRLGVFLYNPKDIEVVLSSTVHIDKSPEYQFFQPWLGDGLLISTGEKWRKHRKLIAPTFHLNVLKTFFEVFNENSRKVVERIREAEVDKEFDCHDYLSECTVEILMKTAMGVSKKSENQCGQYAMAVMKMCNILHLRHTKLWLRPDFIFNLTTHGKEQHHLLNVIHTFTKRVLKQKKEELVINKGSSQGKPTLGNLLARKDETCDRIEPQESTNICSNDAFSFGQAARLTDDLDADENDVGEKKRSAFLDFMIESSQNGVVLTDREIREQVDTIMFEGHDTTAAGSSFFLCVMADRPDIQEKCYQELERIFGDSDRPCSFQDTMDMKYLERCIMETLRLYPPVPIITRQINEEIKLVSSDLTVPADTTILIATIRLHRSAEIYPDPDVFDPDRFLPERSASRHYYSFIPFSAGPRSCVGRKYAMLKLKVLLSTILRNFKIVGGQRHEDWKLQADIILKRSDGFNIKVEPRK